MTDWDEATEIAALELNLSFAPTKMGVRVFAPEWREEIGLWACGFEIDSSIDLKREIHGVSSLQALVLAMKTLSAYLYGSDLYKRGELGIYGMRRPLHPCASGDARELPLSVLTRWIPVRSVGQS